MKDNDATLQKKKWLRMGQTIEEKDLPLGEVEALAAGRRIVKQRDLYIFMFGDLNRSDC